MHLLIHSLRRILPAAIAASGCIGGGTTALAPDFAFGVDASIAPDASRPDDDTTVGDAIDPNEDTEPRDAGPESDDANEPDVTLPDASRSAPDVPDAAISDVPTPDAAPADIAPADAAPADAETPDAAPQAVFEPPSGDAGPRANLIAFNRDLEFNTVIGQITVGRGPGAGEIWILDPDVPESERLVVDAESGGAIMPAWSPDKSQLVFASNRGRDFRADDTPPLDLWTVDIATGEASRLTDTAGHDWTPAWSPDGRHIAFGSTALSGRDAADAFDLWIVGADRSDPHPLFAGPLQDEDPIFGRDSRTLYFVTVQAPVACGPIQIWHVDADVGEASAEPLRDAADEVVCGEDISLSPDGRYLYLTRFENRLAALFRFDLEAGVLSRVADHRLEPWIGPRGERVVYANELNLWMWPLDGGEAQILTVTGRDFFPRWAP